jgi:hypothetical protein
MKPQTHQPIRAGVFQSVPAADAAVGRLQAAGFTAEEISVVCSDAAIEAHFGPFEHQQPAGAHAASAALVGGAIGALAGGLSAAVASVASGGLGLLVFGGLAAWAGGVVGGLAGAMMTRGVERELANYYDQSVQAGKILVAVDLGPQADSARLASQILAAAGAEPVPLSEG